MTINLVKLHETPMEELQNRANELGLNLGSKRRSELVYAIARVEGEQQNQQLGRGVLEVHSEGFGFLRAVEQNFLPGPGDIYVSQSQIRRFRLQTGDTIIGVVRPPKEGERYTALLRVESVNGDPPGVDPPAFESLTAIYPDDRIQLGTEPSLQALDLVAPLGLGQRAILVAPPRTGRADLLQRLTTALSTDDDLEVSVLLIGERPEEIHEWKKNTDLEVIATAFDDQPSRHLQVADIVFERARRMVERGDDVVIVIDSLARLFRAALTEPMSGSRNGSEGDIAALHRVRRHLGSARALEEGGSLTVLGVVSCHRTSPTGVTLLDDLEEVVNWEVHLSRDLADRGISPAIEVSRSGTLRSERLLDNNEMKKRKAWRESLTGDSLEDATSLLGMIDQ
jgi:transcription termination factor Rho